jgi:TPR repeat protein
VTARRIPILVGLAALALSGSTAAQQPPSGIEDLRPQGLQIDGLGAEELPIPVVPGSLPDADATDEALAISNDVFGPRRRVDAAYGAFQRGHFLTALSLALPRAENDDAAAQTLIAEIYAKGLGVAENLPRASGWYALASKNGDPIATFALALMYQDGRGVPKSRARAAELFAQAAELGSIPAKYNLGLLHIEGSFAEPNLVKAAQLIREAADAGMPEAQYDYGMMLMEGAGVAPDPREGARRIALAAEESLAAAQIDYATLLYIGRGVERDLAEAVRWYARAAEGGNPVAQNRYAKLLAAGEGVEIDLEAAAMWRALSRRQGLSDPTLDKLLVSILPDELARAEERARFWPSDPPKAVAKGTAAPAPRPDPTSAPDAK